MRYAQVRKLDISNGSGIGISLFVQGCHFHCFNCFNHETWSFNGGKEWTEEKENKFMKLAGSPTITRVSILGGEPLADENVDVVIRLCKKIHQIGKSIWIYTGYTMENLPKKQREVLIYIDYLVDGRYVDELKGPKLHFRGSKNQHIWHKKKEEWSIINYSSEKVKS